MFRLNLPFAGELELEKGEKVQTKFVQNFLFLTFFSQDETEDMLSFY